MCQLSTYNVLDILHDDLRRLVGDYPVTVLDGRDFDLHLYSWQTYWSTHR